MTDRARLSEPWTGDDQQWWDWYVALADNPPGPGGAHLVDPFPPHHGADQDRLDPAAARPATMGPLTFARDSSVADRLEAVPLDVTGTAYDRRISELLDPLDVEDGPYATGDVSFHSARCFHSAGPNRTAAPRQVLSTIYVADGARVVEAPTVLSGRWRDFLPGVEPGGRVDSAMNPVVGHDRSS